MYWMHYNKSIILNKRKYIMDLSTFFMLGFGTVVGIAIAVVAMGAMNKDKRVRTKYDERQ